MMIIFPSFPSGDVFHQLYWRDWNVTFLSNRTGALKAAGSSLCWEAAASWFKSRCGIFVKFHLRSADISYMRIGQQGARCRTCPSCFSKKRGNWLEKVKHVLVHPGPPEPLSLPWFFFFGSHFLSRSVILSVSTVCLLDLEEEDSLNKDVYQ